MRVLHDWRQRKVLAGAHVPLSGVSRLLTKIVVLRWSNNAHAAPVGVIHCAAVGPDAPVNQISRP
jgi:hypothetical protein